MYNVLLILQNHSSNCMYDVYAFTVFPARD